MIASIFLQLSIQYQFSTINIEPIIDLQRVRANDRNSRKISINSQGLSNDGCPWICNYLAAGIVSREEYCRRHWLHIQA